MTAALLGIAVMQFNWIRYAINLNEKNFDRIVRTSLKNVVEKLEYDEQMEVYSFTNGYSINFSRQDVLGPNINLSQIDINIDPSSNSYGWDILRNNCNCSNCRTERLNYLAHWTQFQEDAERRPLVERISLEAIADYLEQEFAEGGIEIDYKFGVFSQRRQSFVIVDGHYVVEDTSPKEFLPGYKNLYNSEYYVNLFPKESPSPGFLAIYFPSKASIVWGNVWKNLLGTILFTGIILFCFAYTVMVVFRQKKISEMKGDFINNMTHEFKTPIATISLAADSITSPRVINNTEKVQRFANIIKQENKRMNKQVEKVLQMARIDKRNFNLKMSEVNLHHTIQTAVENISLQVEKKEGTVTTDLKANRYTVEGDVTHISNVINNLLDNANKYSPEKPEISVHTKNVRGGVQVIIKDKGIGMTKEARKHIFDKFYRVHTGNLHDVKGFGLGLSYVKAMMMAHKGSIHVKSDLGKGSSFILYFPYRSEN